MQSSSRRELTIRSWKLKGLGQKKSFNAKSICQSISWHRTINEAATYYKIWKALRSQSIGIVLSEKAPGDHVYVNTTKEAEHCPFEQEKEKNKENCS